MPGLWQFQNPTHVVFGPGRLAELKELIAGFRSTRVLLITDPLLSRKLGLADRIAGLLQGLPCLAFDEVEPNPTSDTIDRAVRLVRQERIDLVIGLGGGSSLDAAKLVAILAVHSGAVTDYLGGQLRFERSGLPLVAIPTTAGTGSEVTSVAVVTNTRDQAKQPISNLWLYPTLALVDPELTWSMPPRVTAATGLDALSHALEAAWAITANPASDGLAMEAARLILGNLERACLEPDASEARTNMATASLLAGLAFSQTRTAAVHAVSFVLTYRYHIDHGVACALTLAEFARFNYPAVREKFDRFLHYWGFRDVDGLADRIDGLKRVLGLPVRLSELGIGPADLQLIIQESFHPNIKLNPRPVSEEDLRNIYGNIM